MVKIKKKNWHKEYFVFCMIYLFVLMVPSFLLAEELELFVSDWSPYIDFNLENQGFLSELVRQAYAKQGVKIKLVNHPWNRIVTNIDENHAVSFGWIKNEERLKKWRYSDVLYININVLAIRKGADIHWENFSDLSKFRLIGTLGYSYGDEFERHKSRYIFQESWSDENGLRMMLTQRADAMVIDYAVGQALIHSKLSNEEREQVEFITSPPISSGEMYVVCSQNFEHCQKYLDLFNQGMLNIQADGTYQKIVGSLNK